MADIDLSTPLSEAISDIWRNRALDDQSVQMPGVQADFRTALADDIGTAWKSFIARVLEALAAPPYAVIIRAGDAGRAEAKLAAVAVGIGEMVNPYREFVEGSRILMEIVAKGPSSPDLVWKWHTDSANWPVPNDYSALACLRAAPSGGATQILTLDSVRASGQWRDAALAPLWNSDLTWPVDSHLGGGTFVDRAITPRRLRFRREVMAAHASATYQRAVDEFASLADVTKPDLSALLRPGDIVVFDNSRVMHRSGPVDDPGRRRLLLRTKIKCQERAGFQG